MTMHQERPPRRAAELPKGNNPGSPLGPESLQSVPGISAIIATRAGGERDSEMVAKMIDHFEEDAPGLVDWGEATCSELVAVARALLVRAPGGVLDLQSPRGQLLIPAQALYFQWFARPFLSYVGGVDLPHMTEKEWFAFLSQNVLSRLEPATR